MKKAVIFDLGNVLVTENNTLSLPRFKPHLKKEYTNAELERILYGHAPGAKRWEKLGEETKLFEEYHLGILTSEEFYRRIKEQLEFSDLFTFEQFKKFWPARFGRNDDVIRMLPHLKRHQRYMLSDTNAMDSSWLMAAYPDIFLQFDKNFFSFETKTDKYGVEAWHNIITYSKLPPEAHVFIDDHEGHVERAKKLGFKGIVFTDAKKLWEDLEKLGYL
ncbi:MAG: hypothetical protein NT149_01080 [Candidatus Gottesmanbacteria bacterium]|nr:hypothetical protein [Candidatus Gottesmanbacteria bacterium]